MAEYPRLIHLDEDTEEELKRYLDEELNNHYIERQTHLHDLMRWQRDYWATPSKEKATFPFHGAATIVIPLSAIAIEAVHARSMTMMFAMPQLVSAQSVSAEWDQVERDLEKFMDFELLNKIKIKKPINDCFLEAEKFGTMIGKVGYEKIQKTAVRKIADVEQEFIVTVKDGAVVDCVPDSRFLMPYAAKDPQDAPWVGEEHTVTPYEIRLLEQSGKFYPGTVEELDGYFTQSTLGTTATETGNRFDRNQEELSNEKKVWPKQIDWVEIWLAYDVDRSGRQKEIVVHYHRAARKFLAIRYNWNDDLHRPYRISQYFPVEHRWRGIGICKMNEQFQREVTIQHRQRLDNATLANVRMIVVSKLSGYGPNEPVFPGKMWFVDDMSHINTLQMGEIYASAYNNEQSTQIYSQQRTAVNELTLGMPQVGTPGTATADLARIQEGNRKFDFVYGNFREFVGELINDTAAVVQQFGPRQLEYFDYAEGGELVRSYFQMPSSLIRNGVLISLKAVSQQYNRVLDRQNWEQVAARLNQYYIAMLQLAQFTGNPELVSTIVLKGMDSATEAMRQILESYDVRNIDRLIVKEIEAQVRNALANVQAVQGGAGGSDPSGALPGMEQLSQVFELPGENGDGTVDRLLESVRRI